MTLQLALRCACGGSAIAAVAARADRVFDLATGQDISDVVPYTYATLLHDAARSGQEVELDLYVRRDGLLVYDATRRCAARQTERAVVYCE